MSRMRMAMCFVSGLLLSACGGGPEEEPVVTQTFQRRAFEGRSFNGSIGGQAVTASLSCAKDRVTGMLRFEASGVERRLDARMSYEGLVRGKAVLENGTVEETSKAGVADVKALMLSEGGMVGTYQNSLSPAPVYLHLQSSQDSLLSLHSDPGMDSITWSHWMRLTHCIKADTDTTATIALRIPRISGPQGKDILLSLFVQTAFAIAYDPRCTCQSLEERQTQNLQVDFSVVHSDPESASLVVTASAEDLPYFQKTLKFDLKTGEALLPASTPLP